MAWVLAAILLCVVGLVVVFPLAWKQEAAAQRAMDEAQNRIKTLEQQTVQLNRQLEETNVLKAFFEQEQEATRKEIERLAHELEAAERNSHALQARIEQLERQLKDAFERHRVELEAVRHTLKQAEPSPSIPSAQKPPSSPLLESQENAGRQA